MPNSLNPSNIITVSVQGTPGGLAVPNINTIALISSEVPVWAGVQDFAIYKDPATVAQDFGANSKAAAIANAIFSQSPNPIQTQGYLAIIPRLQSQLLKASNQLQDVNYTAATGGTAGNSITIEYLTGGTAGAEVVAVGIATDITVRIAAGLSTAAQIVAAVNASGAAAALVVATVYGNPSAPQLVSGLGPVNLGGGSASGTEQVHVAMVRTINEVYYVGVLVDFIPTLTGFLVLPAYIAGQDKIGFFASNVKADFAANGILGSLASKTLNKVRGLYYNDGLTQDTINFAAAYASLGLSTDFSGSLTSITMNMKQLVGFAPDSTLTQTDLTTALANGVDIYPAFGFQGLTAQGRLYTSGANEFFDQAYNRLWLKFALQVAGFNYLAQSNTKIPQTEPGMDGLKDAYRRVMAQAVANGMLAPGAWNSPTVFGNVANLYRAITDIGYYVYSAPIANQLPADRQARKAPLVQIAAKESGAIHSGSVIVQVNP